MARMTYIVLARKYRPRTFAQMVGQEHVVRALTNGLSTGRLHHAYLFTGTRGIGKTTVSRILAKSLNCVGPDGQGGVTAEPCGRCGACIEIDADRYVDYIELDAASNRGIDEIRDLLERAAYKPSIGRFKVFMIDEAHQLTKESFNALLKTLEEPPEYLKFVLATTDPEKMLPTVLSRCLQFNLRPMAPEVVHDHLLQVLAQEGVTHDAVSVRLLSRAARGSMRDALSLADQAIAYGGGRLDEAVVRTMLGAVDRTHAVALVRALAQRDGRAVLAGVDELRVNGRSAAGTLEEMAALLQQMAIEQAVPGALDADDPETAAPRELAVELPPDETQLLYGIVLHGREELTLAPDEYAGLTMVLLRLLAFPSQGGAARQATTPAAVAPAPKPAPAPAPAPAGTASTAARTAARTSVAATTVKAPPSPRGTDPEPPPWLDESPPDDAESVPIDAAAPTADLDVQPPPAPEPVQRTPLGDRWATVVAGLIERQAIAALVRELAVQAELVAVDARTWRLRVERESLRAAPLREKLQAALAQMLGEPVEIETEGGVAADSPSRRDAAERERRQREAEQIIHGDPLVQELMGQFKTARIVPGSIKPH
jgi:DNA polymerase-3 subunit gamma/tau